MFTGLVETMAPLVAVRPEPPGKRLILRAPAIAAEAALGESIALSGCCLTVVAIDGDALAFEAGPETLARTTLGRLDEGDLINVERALRADQRLGGHFVSGHVDGLGTLDERRDEGPWAWLWFRAPRELLRQMASKGSIAIDGVSLTLVEVDDERFSVALIPHTLQVTTLGRLKSGDPVNLETDLLAKYVQRLVEIGH